MRLRSSTLTLLVLAGLLAGLVTAPPVGARPLPVAAPMSAPMSAQAARAGSPCADVLLLGVPGSGEVASAARPFGRTLSVFRARFRAAAAAEGRTVQAVLIGRRTAAVGALAGGSTSGVVTRVVTARSVSAWEGDLATATSTVVQALTAAAATCPHQQIVLTGYAQGAMSVHRALLRLPRKPSIFARVVGVALVADGDRVPGTHAIPSGSPMAPRTSRGVHPFVRRPAADVPAAGWTVPVWSSCLRNDLVCQVSRTRFVDAAAIHRGYAAGPGAASVQAVADRIFARATRWAVPVRNLDPVVAALNVPVSFQVPVRVAAADRASVVFAGATGLPSGLTLDAHGLLSGTPTQEGVFTVGFTVANTVSPVFNRPVPGQLELRVLNQAPRTVSAGGEHTCTVRYDGTLWCWGRNTWGQLGNGLRGPGRPDPTQVGTATGWTAVGAGGGHTCGVRAGQLWCWGLNNKGQLGDGTTDVKVDPVRIGTWSGWASVSGSWFSTCGIRTSGTAACWGENSAGQLGDGTRTQRLRPTNLAGTWLSLSTGGWSTCGVQTDHTLWCWGRNDFGQLGDGTHAGRLLPTRIGVGTDWAQVSMGWSHACGVKTTGQLRCWGRGERGQLGDGAGVDRAEPVAPTGDLVASQVAVGDAHTCALTTADAVWCWGSGSYGQTGAGETALTPTQAPGQFTSLSAGWLHTCGISLVGPLACWGANERGQLGNGTNDDSRVPSITVPDLPPANGQTHFTLGTLNVLGDIHTSPYKDVDWRAPARIRAEWQGDGLRELGLPDIFGTQEVVDNQYDALMRATGNAYAAWPGTWRNYKSVVTSIWWLKSRWTLVARETFSVPYIGWPKLRPAVRLRNKQTGREIWVINVHNAPQDQQELRNEAVKVEIAKIKEKLADGIPVFFVGDMNEGKTVLCKVITQTPLRSPRGGTVKGGVCVPPSGHLRVDWIFGSGATWDNYHEWRTTLIGRSTDHHLLMTGVTLQ
jgi:alpha-tubulin suppressor-like RCC1 family protein